MRIEGQMENSSAAKRLGDGMNCAPHHKWFRQPAMT
jgi:hypothetical protein